MRGRWCLQPAGARPFGSPWLVLRGKEAQAVLWNGPVLEVAQGPPSAIRGLGPDVMSDPPDVDGMLVRFRGADQRRELGEALLDQRLLAGIGNMWKAEALFAASLSPWARLADVSDRDLCDLLRRTSELMRAGRRRRAVYRRAGLPCRVCTTHIDSHPQGERGRTAYWCPACQAGTGPTGS